MNIYIYIYVNNMYIHTHSNAFKVHVHPLALLGAVVVDAALVLRPRGENQGSVH